MLAATRDDIHKAKAPNGIDVMRADKPGPDEPHPETTHMLMHATEIAAYASACRMYS